MSTFVSTTVMRRGVEKEEGSYSSSNQVLSVLYPSMFRGPFLYVMGDGTN